MNLPAYFKRDLSYMRVSWGQLNKPALIICYKC